MSRSSSEQPVAATTQQLPEYPSIPSATAVIHGHPRLPFELLSRVGRRAGADGSRELGSGGGEGAGRHLDQEQPGFNSLYLGQLTAALRQSPSITLSCCLASMSSVSVLSPRLSSDVVKRLMQHLSSRGPPLTTWERRLPHLACNNLSLSVSVSLHRDSKTQTQDLLHEAATLEPRCCLPRLQTCLRSCG